MNPTQLIPIRDFCTYHHVEVAFVNTLADNGLVQITTVEQVSYVQPDELSRLEKFVRLHQDLAIHVDDLDIVNDLLDRLESLQQELTHTRNRLIFFESRS